MEWPRDPWLGEIAEKAFELGAIVGHAHAFDRVLVRACAQPVPDQVRRVPGPTLAFEHFAECLEHQAPQLAPWIITMSFVRDTSLLPFIPHA